MPLTTCHRLIEVALPIREISAERHRSVQEALDLLPLLKPLLEQLARNRADRLREAHHRVRRITRERKLDVKPHLSVDSLGVYVVVPIPKDAAVEA